MLEAQDDSCGISHKTFIGLRFVLHGFDAVKQQEVRSKLIKGGAVDTGQYSKECTHVIVDKIVYDDSVCLAARCDGKTLVTSLWVDHCCDIGMLVDASGILYKPVKDLSGIPGAKELVVCLTGYQRQDRDDIMTMVGLMGAQFSKPLIANKVTHLICYKFEGEKHELAKRLKKIKLVNHKWLEDCLKAWKILPEATYNKSGYELEMMQSEAKDSDDEAEGIATRCINERDMSFALHNSAQAVPAEQRSSSNINHVNTSPSFDASKSRPSSITHNTSLHSASVKDKMPRTFEVDDVVSPQMVAYPKPEKHDLVQNIASNDLPPISIGAEGFVHSDANKYSTASYIRKTPMKSMLPVHTDLLNKSPSLQFGTKDASVSRNDEPSEQTVLPQKRKTDSDFLISKVQEVTRDSTPYASRTRHAKKIHVPAVQEDECHTIDRAENEIDASRTKMGKSKALNTVSPTKSSSESKLSDIHQQPNHAETTNKMQGSTVGESVEPSEGVAKLKKPVKTLGSRSRVMAGRVSDRRGSLSSDKASIQSSNVLNPPVGGKETSPDFRKSLSSAFRLTSSSEKSVFQEDDSEFVKSRNETANEETETPEDMLNKTASELDSAELIHIKDGVEHHTGENMPTTATKKDDMNETKLKKKPERKKQPARKEPKVALPCVTKEDNPGLETEAAKDIPRPNGKPSKANKLDKQVEKENMPISVGVSNNQKKVSVKKQASKCDEEMRNVKTHFPPRPKPEPGWFILSGHRLQRKEFRKIIAGLRGRCCRDSHQWSYQATHFIVPEPVRRTEKFFAAAASGRWVLKTDFLTASSQEGRFLLEENYEWHKKGLSEDGAINLEAPRKWRILREKTGHGALYKLRVIIYGECIAPPLETLKRVIKAGDGDILATSPPYTRFLESGVDYAIVMPGMPRADVWVQEFLAHKIPCIVADYMVDYVCKPGYSLDKHVLYNTQAWAEKAFADMGRRAEEAVVDHLAGFNGDIACRVCGSRDREEVMLICGDESGGVGCGVGAHIDCCDPPLKAIPEGDWFCSDCSGSSTGGDARDKKGRRSALKGK